MLSPKKYLTVNCNFGVESVLAIMSMRKFGKEVFPGADSARVVFRSAATTSFNFVNSYMVHTETLMPAEIIFSALVDTFELRRDKVWKRFVQWSEVHERSTFLDLRSMLSDVQWNSDEPEIGFGWALQGLSAIERAGEDYFTTEDEFRNEGRFFELLCSMWAANKFGGVAIARAVNDFFPRTGRCEWDFSSVLQFIKREDDPILGSNPEGRGLGRFVANACKSDRKPFSLPRASLAVYRDNNDSVMAAWNWVKTALDAWYARQKDFHSAVEQLQSGKGFESEVMEIWPGAGLKKVVLIDNLEHRMMPAACRFFFGKDFGVLAQRSEKNGFQIFSNPQVGFNPLSLAVAMIVKAEAVSLKRYRLVASVRDFSRPGSFDGLEHLCHLVQTKENGKLVGTNALLNRSDFNPSAKLISVPWDRLCALLIDGLQQNLTGKEKGAKVA